MLTPEEYSLISRLIHHQVVPAIGCTEPICVALAVSRAVETLGIRPATINVLLSANILKNAMGVGIPGTGMVGLPIAIALGALIGRSELGLEVLRDTSPEAVEAGKKFISEERIHIALKENAPDKLYVEVTVKGEDGTEARTIIAREHTRFCLVTQGDTIIYKEEEETDKTQNVETTSPEKLCLTLHKVWEYAMNVPISDLSLMGEAARLNLAAADKSLKGNYGHCLGKTLTRPLGRGIMGDNIFSHILSTTSAACDARMAGAMIPVMSNSGSGNQGICATNPVAVFAHENHNTDEETLRALTLSHLTAIYIKQHLGALSALCGCVVASTGSSVGITYLMGGNYEQACSAVKNMIANLTGMICDGAKPSCALKLTTGVSTAVLSAMLAMQGNCVTPVEGIIDESVDRSIRNLVSIGAEAMNETDRCVLGIMTGKEK